MEDTEMQDMQTESLPPISIDNPKDSVAGSRKVSAGAGATDLVKNGESSKPQLSLEDSLLQRVSTIKEGDNVLLRLPSDMVKAVVASEHG